jgi:predicted nucleic acid-binding protein
VAELYVLDTSAIFTLTDQEVGADEVEDILNAARADECQIEICSISLMELSYMTLRELGEDKAVQLVALVKSWPITWVYPDEKLLLQAARLKAFYRLSLADALIAAVAKLHDATLVHKDPEFESLSEQVSLLTLPYKTSSDDGL